ncbi:MAG: class I adenylate-forming enzyme family protein [Candidatus Marinimicrobia bacterium]|nr:class I adenylate-forming enzyme family protein [Candidatus Neomarinimicrobiota bacterium]MDD5581947.1 class I adenylate-forming enzyme family protein [Candidatus Neomarinimicrobiota bacterium]
MNFSMSLYSSFFQITKQKHDQVFLMQEGENYTYYDVLNKSLQIAGYLLEVGVKKRSRVAIMLLPSPEFYFIILALSRLECTVVPVDPNFKSLALRHVLSDADISTIIYYQKFEKSVADAIDILESISTIIAVGQKGDLSDLYIDSTLKHSLYGGPFHPDNKQEAVIFFSSGTSGPSKGGIFTNQQLLKNAQSFYETMMFHKDEILCAQFPLHHFWGFTTVLVTSLMKGNRVILNPSFTLPSVPESSRGIILIGETTYFEALSTSLETMPENYLYGITAGGHLKSEVQSWFYQTFHFPIYRGYGLIEAGPIILINNDERKLRSIGVPLHNIAISLRNGEKVVSDQKVCELCIWKESLISGFTSNQDKLKTSLDDDGWFHTGDLCYQDLDGYFYFVDRVENRIRINGFDIFPEKMEDILKKHPNVQEAVIVGIPIDNRGNEKCVAFVVPKKLSQANADELKAYLKGKVPRYQIPSDVIFTDHLLVGATGKIARQTIRINAIHRNSKNNNISSKMEDDE